jgi:hypothetical protein
MTRKPKMRKPATKATPYNDNTLPIENRHDRNFTSNDIPKTARWRFLEADRQYHAATAVDPELARLSRRRHKEESARIVDKLLTLTPDNFDDVDALVRFSIEMLIDVYGADAKSGAGIPLLRNASAGISTSTTRSMRVR